METLVDNFPCFVFFFFLACLDGEKTIDIDESLIVASFA
jgi:hypothetical protein